MEYLLYKNIVSNPDICNGRPVIKGTRITVKSVIRFINKKKKDKKVLKNFPRMAAKDLQACKEFNSIFFEKPLIVTIKA